MLSILHKGTVYESKQYKYIKFIYNCFFLLSIGSQALAQPYLTNQTQQNFFQATNELFWLKLLNEDIQVKDVESFKEMKKYFEDREREIDERFITKTYYDGNDKISCIDMYHQPGLSSNSKVPNLLRSEPLIATPPPTPFTQTSNTVSLNEANGIKTTFEISNTPKCSQGTIPLLRVKLEDIARFKTLTDYFKKEPNFNRNFEDGKRSPTSRAISPVHEYATVRKSVYNWGAAAFLSLNKPLIESKTDFSLSQIWVSGGNSQSGTLETVEAGIQAYPTKYRDSIPRLFVYFTPDNYGPESCYNRDCDGKGKPGFIQTDNSIVLGGKFPNYSIVGGEQIEVSMEIIRDSTNGNWWLKVGNKWAGYWPTGLFDASGIKNQAERVIWGGEVYDSNTTRHTTTEMGSGRFASEGFGKAAFQRQLKLVDTSNYYQTLTNPVLSEDKPNCYSLNYFQDDGSSWGSHFYFGGKGYSSICP